MAGGLKVLTHFSVLVFGKCLAVRNIFIQVTTIVVFFFFWGAYGSLALVYLLALALVLVPTRELCMQVYEILQKLLHRFHWIVPGYIMGGENRSKEKARLRKGQNHF